MNGKAAGVDLVQTFPYQVICDVIAETWGKKF